MQESFAAVDVVRNRFSLARRTLKQQGRISVIDRRISIMVVLILLCMCLSIQTSLGQQLNSPAARSAIVDGTVYDDATGQPIPFATVQTTVGDRSTLANEEGRYRILLTAGPHQLRFSHIAYYSQTFDLAGDTVTMVLDVRLRTCMVDIGTMKVYSRKYDPGQQIIVEAIRRKKDILAHIHDYSCDAYTKLVVVDESKKDSSRIFLMTESQVTALWEQPDKYKEILTSRRQTANIQAENNLVTIGEILNFNRNRIDLGEYSIVSPTAEDALDHYNYYLLDTVYIDSLAVFRLEIEPKNPDDPLFEGYIHIADSTYDVVQVEVGFSRGVDIPILKSPRYSQKFACFQNEYWMPIEIRFGADIEFDVAIPGIPKKLNFSHLASLYGYRFDQGHSKGTFDEFAIEVDRHADEIDSLDWRTRQTIPLTTDETAAYKHIDSLEHAPKPIGKTVAQGLAGVAFLLLVGQPDIYRFNRVEGPFLGFGFETDKLHERLKLRLKTGYAFDADRSEHQIGATWRLHERHRLDIGFDYYDKVVHRPTTVASPNYNPTFLALVDRWDPFDYYRAEGYQAFTSTKVFNRTRLTLSYGDFHQYSLPVRSDFALTSDDGLARSNPAIVDGIMRSVGAELTFDSRPMFKNKGREVRIDDTEFLTVTTGVEYASPEFIDNDFYFKRYFVDIRRRQRLSGMGLTSLNLFAGSSEGSLPPQKYFTMDFGNGVFNETDGYITLNEHNFCGSRALAVHLSHQFKRRLFVASGLPLIKDIPLWLSVHGGAFWTDFRNHPAQPGDDQVLTAPTPYSELGFGVGNLTPFMMPFNLAVYFTWQLSDYETSDWLIGVGLEL
jgi:hypothetical protein